MASFAPIAPSHLYPELEFERALRDYRLYLAHEVVEYPQYHRALQTKEEVTTILDNGTVELGHPVELSVMREAVKVCLPSVIVLPDVLGDFEQTLKLTASWYIDYFNLAREFGTDLMVVPQGKTPHEIHLCTHKLLALTGARWVGVSRYITNTLGSRLPFVIALRHNYPAVRVHLLGCSNNLFDDIACARLPWVQGQDSSLPVLLAGKQEMLDRMPGQFIYDNKLIRPSRETVGWETLEYNSLMEENISTWRRWISHKV